VEDGAPGCLPGFRPDRLKLRVPGGKLRRHNLAVRLQLRDPGTQPRHLLSWRDTLRTGHDATMIRMFSP
jgi:hypothetical protein